MITSAARAVISSHFITLDLIEFLSWGFLEFYGLEKQLKFKIENSALRT